MAAHLLVALGSGEQSLSTCTWGMKFLVMHKDQKAACAHWPRLRRYGHGSCYILRGHCGAQFCLPSRHADKQSSLSGVHAEFLPMVMVYRQWALSHTIHNKHQMIVLAVHWHRHPVGCLWVCKTLIESKMLPWANVLQTCRN